MKNGKTENGERSIGRQSDRGRKAGRPSTETSKQARFAELRDSALWLSDDLRFPKSFLATALRALRSFKNRVFCPMKLEIDVPNSTFSAMRQAPHEFSVCLRLMAAAKLYEIGQLSQERAAELAGQSRHEFLLSLSRLGVSPFQGVDEDLASMGHLS